MAQSEHGWHCVIFNEKNYYKIHVFSYDDKINDENFLLYIVLQYDDHDLNLTLAIVT